MTRFATAATAVVAAASLLVELSEAHIYQLSPISRQTANGAPFRETDDPLYDACPHCYNAHGTAGVKQRGIDLMSPEVLEQYGGGNEFPLAFVPLAPNGNYMEPNEVAVRHGVCGDPEEKLPKDSNRYSTATSNWDVVSTYQSGQEIEIIVVMNYYHWGHLEFFICNADSDPNGIPTQECFNKYPLTRAPGDDVNSPIDPNFPGRYYNDPPCRGKTGEVDQGKPQNINSGENMKMTYVLPAMTCDKCILQMVYHTGNTCYHIGYEEFNPPSWPSSCAPNKADWIDTTGQACGQGGYYPEEFWACTDISITSGAPPAPTPSDTTDCAEEWEQCGGTGGGAVNEVWTGPTCCVAGTTCVYKDVYWSDCRKTSTVECAQEWEQCGGAGGGAVDGTWTGPACCVAGSTCTTKDEWWADCRPDDYP